MAADRNDVRRSRQVGSGERQCVCTARGRGSKWVYFDRNEDICRSRTGLTNRFRWDLLCGCPWNNYGCCGTAVVPKGSGISRQPCKTYSQLWYCLSYQVDPRAYSMNLTWNDSILDAIAGSPTPATSTLLDYCSRSVDEQNK